MKKLFSLLCPLLLVLVMALSACSDKPEQESQTGNSLPAVGTSDTKQAEGSEADPSVASGEVTDVDPVETTTEEPFLVTEEIVVTIGDGESVIGD